jgi:hypothetical protein
LICVKRAGGKRANISGDVTVKNAPPRSKSAQAKLRVRGRPAPAPLQASDNAASRRDLEQLLYEAARLRANRAASGS